MTDKELTREQAHAEAEDAFREHAEISRKVVELEQWLDDPAACDDTWASCLGEKLVPLAGILKDHFRGEEESALYRDVPVDFPLFADTIERLFNEHYDIFREVESLIQAAHTVGKSFAGDIKELSTRTRRIIFALRRHEAEENEILHKAYWDDLGGGD